MSAKWMSYFFDHTNLAASELLLALAIADHSNDAGLAWPGVELLAKKIRLKERQTQTLIKSLEGRGFLKVERHNGRGNVATFHLQRVQCGAPFSDDERVQSEDTKGCNLGQKRVQSGALPLNKEEPFKEPIQNHAEVGVSESENAAGNARFISARMARKASAEIRAKSDPMSSAFIAFREDLEDWHIETLNACLTPFASTGEEVAWLYDNNFSIEDVRAYFEFARKEKWRNSPPNLTAIVKGIATWKSAKKVSAEPTIEQKHKAAEEQSGYMRPAPGQAK